MRGSISPQGRTCALEPPLERGFLARSPSAEERSIGPVRRMLWLQLRSSGLTGRAVLNGLAEVLECVQQEEHLQGIHFRPVVKYLAVQYSVPVQRSRRDARTENDSLHRICH